MKGREKTMWLQTYSSFIGDSSKRQDMDVQQGVMPSQQFSLDCNINTNGWQKAELDTITTGTKAALQTLEQQPPKKIIKIKKKKRKKRKWRAGGRDRSIMADSNKKLKYKTPRDLTLRRTLELILPAVCDRNPPRMSQVDLQRFRR